MRYLQLDRDVLWLSGTLYSVGGRFGQPLLGALCLIPDSISMDGLDVILRRTVWQQVQACTNGIEAGVGRIFDIDAVGRLGQEDILIPVVPPVVHPCGYLRFVDFPEISWMFMRIGHAVVGVFGLLTLVRTESGSDGKPRYP